MFKKIKTERKGAISIIMVLFILTLVSSLSLLFDMSYSMFGMREIQSKIDMAGINALYSTIDLEALRNEEMGVINGGGSISHSGVSNLGNFAPVVRSAYIEELQKIRYHGDAPTVRRAEVSFEYSNFGLGYNSAVNSSGAKKRPQIVLESIVSYEVPVSTIIDETTRKVTGSVDSYHQTGSFTVTVQDIGADGKKTVLVHSITRIVLK